MTLRRPHLRCEHLLRLVVGGMALSGQAAAGASPPHPAGHWALRPLVKPALPSPNTATEAHPIDAFIDARLASAGLSPTPATDRRTLLRRVYFNLTGLPPTPEEVADFVRDPDPMAYEAAVDRLLASPRHGERWARHWLDTVHFADTHGFEHDVFRPHAWRFRDYVIRSFNVDTPWPRFIREQLAADRFFPDEPQLTAALGFLGAGTFDLSAEGTAYASFEYVDRDDLVTQTMASFVSTTAQCARCHAHKFDPITQEDYFALQAVFAGVGKGNVAYEENADVAAARKKWSQLRQSAETAGPAGSAGLLVPENDALVRDWEARWINDGGRQLVWVPLKPSTFTAAIGATLSLKPDDSILSSGLRPDTETYTITAASPLPEISALRVEAMTDESLPHQGPGRLNNGNFHLSELEVHVFRAGAAEPERAVFRRATADFDQFAFAAPGAIDGDLKSSWAVHPRVGEAHEIVASLTKPLAVDEADRIVVTLKQLQGGQHLLGRFRLSVTNARGEVAIALPPAARAALAQPVDDRSRDGRAALASAVLFLRSAEELAALPPPATVWAASAEAQRERGQKAGFAQPRVIRVLARGDLDKPGEPMTPGALSAIASLPARFALANPDDEAGRRAALADWIAHRDNPLTWRSIVNRVWHYHFGRGLCDTPSDFGKMGGTPTHPELIDWLAAWFRDDAGGSLKKLHRLIVTSAAYQRQSITAAPPAPGTPAAEALAPVVLPDPSSNLQRHLAIDPDNRLLWRAHRIRLDADSYRDAVLAASRRLDLTMGGPGVQHFASRPGPQSTPSLNYANFDWSRPGVSRRSIYRVVWRGIADPFMDALDFPDMGLLSPVRGFSASPLQALALLNNPFVLFHSGQLAEWAETSSMEADVRIRAMVQAVWLRDPSGEEGVEFRALAESHGLAAVARLLFNSNEFMFVD